MGEEKKKNRKLIISILLLIGVIATSTLAWFIWSSRDNANMKVTVGDLADITIKGGNIINITDLSPTFYYDENSYTDFKIKKKKSLTTSLTLKVSIDVTEISEELKNESFKYVLLKSTDNTNFTELTNGSLENASAGSRLNLFTSSLEDIVSYYKLYFWIDGNNENTTNMQNKTFKGVLNVDVSEPVDLMYNVVKLDGNTTDSLPSTGFYTLSNYTCDNGATLTYDETTRKITTNKVDNCTLEYTTKSNPLLKDVVKIGDYISYTGNNGCSGTSCQGYNANQDSDTTNYTYGYCNSADYKFYTYGWRVAYIKDNSVYIVSAGSPECVTSTASVPTTTIDSLKTASLKYCNTDYLQGGVCDDTTGHPLRGGDFYNITKGLFGDSNARGLYTYTDSSYDSGVSVTDSNMCFKKYSIKECGYNSDLIDNGGYYWFGSAYDPSNTLAWNPFYRGVNSSSSSNKFGIRPVLKLDSTITVNGGSGTVDKPYTISTRSGA